MMYRKSAALLAALSLAGSPALALPSAQPLSIERASAPTEDGSQLEGSWFPAVLFLAIIVGGVLLATGVIFDNDHPRSP